MEERYLVPGGFGQGEHTEKRSRFIGRVWRISSEEEALARLTEVRALERDARHNVWAYQLHSGAMRFSDDGEPQGTGGMPVLDTFRKRGVTDFVCVVTRYFGGILLGAGGLVRAYGKAAVLGLEAAGLARMRPLAVLEVRCPYGLYDRVRQEAAALGAGEPEVTWAEAVSLRLRLPLENAETFSRRLGEISAGAVTAREQGRDFDALPVEPGAL